jgi:hypothetical protein
LHKLIAALTTPSPALLQVPLKRGESSVAIAATVADCCQRLAHLDECLLPALNDRLELAKFLPLHEFLVRADAIKHHAALERSTVCGVLAYTIWTGRSLISEHLSYSRRTP